MMTFPAAFPDGMSADHPYGPWQALADGCLAVGAVALLGLLVLGVMALAGALRPPVPGAGGRREIPLAERRRRRIVKMAGFFALVCAFPAAYAGWAAVRLAPSDAVTGRTWAYEGEAAVLKVSSGKQSWVRLRLAGGEEVVLHGISDFELNEELGELPFGASRPVSVRCQAWHRWFPGEGDYVSAWCENPSYWVED
ncbi:hypothetical protein DWB68_03180 [Galactobacter valiniphilus]|uniref:Uncharacterized protein n=1 Tax=Galactobacter valiniphilus TaxID=2676122 RepID=A0A399JLA7_9MICC|nr:hypothetical protein [Galactobacter valiniphilus]RII43316.1 hypothetical protein DWB68_03180 [Galactobacter valiniphilus]